MTQQEFDHAILMALSLSARQKMSHGFSKRLEDGRDARDVNASLLALVQEEPTSTGWGRGDGA